MTLVSYFRAIYYKNYNSSEIFHEPYIHTIMLDIKIILNHRKLNPQQHSNMFDYFKYLYYMKYYILIGKKLPFHK